MKKADNIMGVLHHLLRVPLPKKLYPRKRLHITSYYLFYGILMSLKIILKNQLRRDSENHDRERQVYTEKICQFWIQISEHQKRNSKHRLLTQKQQHRHRDGHQHQPEEAEDISEVDSQSLNQNNNPIPLDTVPSTSGTPLPTLKSLDTWADPCKGEKQKCSIPFVCLSVRTGFDLILEALNFEKGSQILMSAINIKDMGLIVEKHGLIPVPIDIDMHDMCPKFQILEHDGVIKKGKAKAIVIAHLFGSQIEDEKMERLIEIAHQNDMMIIEDCAQLFSDTVSGYLGNPNSDVSMFSFGNIKTCTACGGGVLFFHPKHSQYLLPKVKEIYDTFPIQTELRALSKLVNLTFLYLMIFPTTFGFIYYIFETILRQNFETFIISQSRGFTGDDLFRLIRLRPSLTLLKMLEYRLRTFKSDEVKRRAAYGHCASALLPLSTPPAPIPSHLLSIRHLPISQHQFNSHYHHQQQHQQYHHHHQRHHQHHQQQQQHQHHHHLQHHHRQDHHYNNWQQINQNSEQQFNHNNKSKHQTNTLHRIAFHLDQFMIQPGRGCKSHHYWLFPIVVEDPQYFICKMREMGFDSTQGASQLSVVEVPKQIKESDPHLAKLLDPIEARYCYTHLFYLPVNDHMPYHLIQEVMDTFVHLMISRPEQQKNRITLERLYRNPSVEMFKKTKTPHLPSLSSDSTPALFSSVQQQYHHHHHHDHDHHHHHDHRNEQMMSKL